MDIYSFTIASVCRTGEWFMHEGVMIVQRNLAFIIAPNRAGDRAAKDGGMAESALVNISGAVPV